MTFDADGHLTIKNEEMAETFSAFSATDLGLPSPQSWRTTKQQCYICGHQNHKGLLGSAQIFLSPWGLAGFTPQHRS